jgi:Holliday junction resolvasome RuvABC endonuclease subunit
MKEQYDLIKNLIDKTNPDYICLEDCQFQNNYRTYQQLSVLQGTILALLFERNIPFTIIEPSAWKSFSLIKGRKREEQKANTIQMVKKKFNIDVVEDVADAIGIGVWAINHIKQK